MYIIAIFLSFAIALIGVGGLELALTYEHGVQQRTAGRLADDFIPRAEQAYATQIGALVQQGVAIVPGRNANVTSTPAPMCPVEDHVSNCNYTAGYTVTTTGSTATGGATGVQANYVNTTLGEERIAATVAVSVFDARGNTVAKRTRTFILRTIPGLAPYASIIDSTATEDVYQTAGTQHAALAEGDSTCNGTNGCDNTVLQSYAACNWGNGVANATQINMQRQWCSSPPPNAAYNANGAANANGNWVPHNTTNTSNTILNTTNASTGGSN